MSYLTFKKVRTPAQADYTAVQATLFRGDQGRICGWYIGPVSITERAIDLPYLPRSREALASVAVVRAVEAAQAIHSHVCIIDPDDLWTSAWAN